MFTLDAFSIFAADIRRFPNYFVEARSRVDSVPESRHLKALLSRRIRNRSTPLCRIVSHHIDHHCADVRDRVFGLLSLSSKHAIRADYTKSSLEVVLQLLEQEVCPADSSVARDMSELLRIMGAFYLGPLAAESADMLRQRRLVHAAPRPSPQEVVFDRTIQRQILLKCELCCNVWEDDAGNLVTSLLKGEAPSTPDKYLGDLERFCHGSDVAFKQLKNPLGKVVALADKKVKARDRLLFFSQLRASNDGGRNFNALSPASAGLVVRPSETGIHIVVGQVVVNFRGIKIRSDWSSSMDPTDQYGFENGDCGYQEWWVFMSPADIFVFAVQDLRARVGSPDEGEGPVVELMYCPEETAKRLATSVTADLASSYAIRKHRRPKSPPRGPIVLRSGSIDLP